ncbi:hypothetical protein [Flavobacterium sangjuense]|uniref:Uncharacterized protein n=1 Tax=Flavobacterium sangjuense TaxID=2518177 RepID=A0A4P7PTQ4_9FLAO|nr:hypothetical protein [Flavobacterium sangjuense]QBZ98331.1 hypothetical protein GS03_01836 [Flavobacterium sangjuense]
MKNLLLVFTLLFGFTAFSQGLTLKKTTSVELKLEKGKIYQNNEQIPSYQVKKILASNLHALHLYKQAKSKEGIGATLLGLGVTLSVIDLAVGLFSDTKYPTALTYAGVGMVAVSIPVLSGRSKKIEEAVKSYNDGLKNTGSVDFDLNAVANQNGVGIQIKF